MRNRAQVNCPYCNQEMHSFQALGNHIHHRHPDKPKIKCLLRVTCSNCGKVIKKPPSHIRKHNFCSEDCYLAWLPTRDYETRRILSRNISNATKNAYAQGYRTPPCPNPKGSRLASSTIAKMLGRIPWNKDLTKDTDTRIAKYAQKVGRKGRIPWNKGLEGYNAGFPRTTTWLERMSQAMSVRWQDPEFVKKMMVALHKKPTKPEMQLEAILNKHFPQFKYNGDGRLGITLGGLTPDFVNVNGKKDLIEVFGDYYHSPEVIGDNWRRGELGKIMLYNSVGWRCLIIWEHELKKLPQEAIIKKIRRFQCK